MKYRFVFGLSLVGILFLLAACGTTSGPSGSQGTVPSTPVGQTASTGMQRVQVILFDDHMSSSMMSFVPGTPYHFVVTNNGQQPYAFTMMSQDREQEMEHVSMSQRHRVALYMNDSIAPGQTQAFDYTFGSSMMGQHLEFACYQQNSTQVHMRLAFTPQS